MHPGETNTLQLIYGEPIVVTHGPLLIALLIVEGKRGEVAGLKWS